MRATRPKIGPDGSKTSRLRASVARSRSLRRRDSRGRARRVALTAASRCATDHATSSEEDETAHYRRRTGSVRTRSLSPRGRLRGGPGSILFHGAATAGGGAPQSLLPPRRSPWPRRSRPGRACLRAAVWTRTARPGKQRNVVEPPRGALVLPQKRSPKRPDSSENGSSTTNWRFSRRNNPITPGPSGARPPRVRVEQRGTPDFRATSSPRGSRGTAPVFSPSGRAAAVGRF
jgi:hypothetical protein